MELHSYAKTRSSKKWTIDQKRKLVENRITLDVLFNKKTFNLADSWIKLIKVSDFESFDIQFIRNQWINILSKYKNLIQLHTNDINVDINEETRDLLTSEWEFFDKIYRWIKYKERLNHNYNNIILEEINNETNQQQLELFSTESSTEDDNDVVKIKKSSIGGQQNMLSLEQKQKNDQTSKNYNNNNPKNPNLSQNINLKNIMTSQFQNNINSGCSSENSISKSILNQQQKMKIKPISNIQLLSQQNNNKNSNLQQNEIINNFQNNSKELKIKPINLLAEKIDKISPDRGNGSAGTSFIDNKSQKLQHKRKSNKLKKYKKYRKYFNYKQSSRKIERKLNVFCQIFAQIVEKDYPDINITNLLYSSAEDSTSSSD